MNMGKKKVVVIGGGTGTYTLLRGLRQYADEFDITAIVTMADSGGSTGRLRDEFGQLPVGDVRQALAALAPTVAGQSDILRSLFLYRFEKGEGLTGHNFGNLFLTALTDILGSEVAAIEAAGQLLRISGRVVPVTTDDVHLEATYVSGRVVIGEHAIDMPAPEYHEDRIADLRVTSGATLYAGATEAIATADYIIFGPGDLYTSILANCVVGDMRAQLQQSQALRIFVANLMARPGQTIGMHLPEYLAELELYAGVLPHVVVVPSEPLPADLVARYESEEAVHPLRYDVGAYTQVRLLAAPVVSLRAPSVSGSDVVPRSLIRHDSAALARTIVSVLHSERTTGE
jgi:uncharacterized cofD-like protein